MSKKNSNLNKDVTQMLPNKTIADLKIAQEGQRRCFSCMESYSDEYDVCPFCGATTDIEVENALHMYPGTVLHEKYVIGKVIGYGGFGVTYLAWDTVLQIKVAIKEYLPSEFSTRAMGQSQVTVFSGDKTIQFADGMGKFLDEAKRLAKFRNESGIVRIFDSFNENGTAYIVMEYLRGETLAERLEREHTIPVEEAIQMLMPIIESLDKVNAEGIIHRDIAPDNIFLTEDGEVKLIDFGAARYATTSRSRSLTVIIKPGYSPEEQYMSRGDQGPHTDVYSVGACLYRMVTGEVPPDAMERHATFEKNHRDMLKPIRKYVKDIDERRENAIYNALNVRIVDRTPDMVSLAGELLSEEPVKRRKSGIRKIDPLTWPLWAKVGIPASLALVVTLSILLATGVVGPRSNLKSGIVIGLGQTLVPNVVGIDVDEASKKLEKDQLRFQISDKIQSELIGRDLILLQDPDAFNVVDIGTTLDITKSEGLGDGTVPSVVGQEINKALEMMKGEGLTIETVEQPDSVIAEGCVISQSVEPGTLHHREIPITLTVSTGNASADKTKSVTIPDLVGKTYDKAAKILEELKLSVKIEEVYNAEIPVDQVVGQFPTAGTKGHQADIVTLTVNKGQEMVTVVDVREKSLESALATLEGLGLDVYTNAEENDLYKAGTVFKQSIEPGKQVKPGAKITITYSSGKSVKVPDVTGMKIKNAQEMLVSAGLTVSAEYEPSDTVSKDTVIRQSPAKGAAAKKGDIVVLAVSSGVNGGTGKSAKDNDKGDKNGKGDSKEDSKGKDGTQAVLVALMLDSKPAKLVYTVGESLDTAGLRILASYSDGTKKDVTGSCSFNETLFSIAGGHSITATYKEGTVTKTTSFAVTVNQIKAEFAESPVSVKVGSKVALTLNNVPDSAKVTWASKNKIIAEVSSSGEVKGVKIGQTVVTATVTVGKSTQTVSCTVFVVEQDIEADKITLDTETLSIYEGQTRELTATITPTTVTNKELTWSTSDSKIAEVKNGVVTGIGVGSCTITVKTSNGKTSKCTVEVKELTVKKIEAVGDFRTEYYPTESFSPKGLMVEVTYSDNSKKTISDGFTYSEEKKSKIDSIVTVKYKEKTCEIKIHYNEASVTIIGNSEVLVGGSLELSVTTNPPGQNVTEWTSSDNSIAKVNAKGVVTGIKVGKVTITAKAKYATDTKTITVKEKAIKSVSIYHGFNKSSGYYLGDTISTDGLKIKVVYVDNTTEIISSGIEITPDKVEKSPNQTVTVKWGSYTAGELNVKSKSPSIVINRYVTTLDEGKDYQFVAKTDPERVSVTWNSTGPVTVDANGKVMGTGDGEATVTVKMTYNGTEYKDTRNLTVRGRTVSSISIGGSFKTTYWYGEKIDTSGMVVTVKYSNGQTEEKTYGFDISPSSATSNKIISSTTGSSINETITVTYGGKSATKQITIKAPRITITANKTVLYQGENTSIEIEKIPSEGFRLVC